MVYFFRHHLADSAEVKVVRKKLSLLMSLVDHIVTEDLSRDEHFVWTLLLCVHVFELAVLCRKCGKELIFV